MNTATYIVVNEHDWIYEYQEIIIHMDLYR